MVRMVTNKTFFLSITFGLLSITLSAQNAVWNERIDSSVVQARRVRPELTCGEWKFYDKDGRLTIENY